MAVRKLFTDDELLDAARRLIAGGGPRAVTLQAIAAEAGATNGSIYHRFATVDELIARVWLRAVSRTQEVALAAASDGRDADAVVRIALSQYDFCLAERGDAVVLAAFRPADLARLSLGDAVRDAIERANEPIEELTRSLARGCFGHARRADRELLLLVCVDLPYGFVRRHLDGGTSPPRTDRERLRAAVRAAMKEH